jgi:hypothetical protein
MYVKGCEFCWSQQQEIGHGMCYVTRKYQVGENGEIDLLPLNNTKENVIGREKTFPVLPAESDSAVCFSRTFL